MSLDPVSDSFFYQYKLQQLKHKSVISDELPIRENGKRMSINVLTIMWGLIPVINII